MRSWNGGKIIYALGASRLHSMKDLKEMHPFFYDKVLREKLFESRSLGLPESFPVIPSAFQKQTGLRYTQDGRRHSFHRRGRVYRNALSRLQSKTNTEPRLNGYSEPPLKTLEISDDAIFPKRTTGSRRKKVTGALGSYYLIVKRVHPKPRSTDSPHNGLLREDR
jgi:hypothetical protein